MKKQTEYKTDNGVIFSTPYSYKVGKYSYETLDPKSQTVPDQSKTVKELIELHTRGITLNMFKEGIWDSDDFGEEMNPFRKQDLDLTDIDDIRDDIQRGKDEVHKIVEQRKKDAAKAHKSKIIEEYKKDLEKNPDINPKDVLKETVNKKITTT